MSRRRDTEARVLERAERLFVRRGYAATSVRDIAAEAGVSVGTVVSVGGKAELFVRCMERRATADAVAVLVREGIGVYAVRQEERSLEDVFMALTRGGGL